MIPQIGDILFKRGSAGSRSGQTMARRKRANFGHVLISLGSDTLIESMLGHGVRIVPITVLQSDVWRATRSNALTALLQADTEFYGQVHNAIFFNYRRIYNVFLSKKGSAPRRFREAAFCSELAALVYRQLASGNPKLALPINQLNPEDVLPVDLEPLLAHPDWTDVGSCYDRMLSRDPEESRQSSERLRVMWDWQLGSALQVNQLGSTIAAAEARLLQIADMAAGGMDVATALGVQKSFAKYWRSAFDIAKNPKKFAEPNPLLALPPISFMQQRPALDPSAKFSAFLLDAPGRLVKFELEWWEAFLRVAQEISNSLTIDPTLAPGVVNDVVQSLKAMSTLIESIQDWPNYQQDLRAILADVESTRDTDLNEAAVIFRNVSIEFVTRRLRIATEDWRSQIKEVVESLEVGNKIAAMETLALLISKLAVGRISK